MIDHLPLSLALLSSDLSFGSTLEIFLQKEMHALSRSIRSTVDPLTILRKGDNL